MLITCRSRIFFYIAQCMAIPPGLFHSLSIQSSDYHWSGHIAHYGSPRCAWTVSGIISESTQRSWWSSVCNFLIAVSALWLRSLIRGLPLTLISSNHSHISLMPLLRLIIEHCSFICECVCVFVAHLPFTCQHVILNTSSYFLFWWILIFSFIHSDLCLSCDVSSLFFMSTCTVFLINNFFLKSGL